MYVVCVRQLAWQLPALLCPDVTVPMSPHRAGGVAEDFLVYGLIGYSLGQKQLLHCVNHRAAFVCAALGAPPQVQKQLIAWQDWPRAAWTRQNAANCCAAWECQLLHATHFLICCADVC